jgi:hypothetical protein
MTAVPDIAPCNLLEVRRRFSTLRIIKAMNTFLEGTFYLLENMAFILSLIGNTVKKNIKEKCVIDIFKFLSFLSFAVCTFLFGDNNLFTNTFTDGQRYDSPIKGCPFIILPFF